VQAKLSNAVESVAVAVSPADEENKGSDSEEEEKEEEFITTKEFLANPCLFMPVICFTLTGIFGVIVLIGTMGGKGGNLALIGSIVLFIMGIWAAFEIWALGSLADQINRLKMIRQELQAETGRLQGQVGDLAAENAELEENVKNFDEQNDILKKNVKEFDDANEDLRGVHAQLEQANSELKTQVNGLHEQNEKLTSTLNDMTAQNDRLQGAMGQFDDLRADMESMADQAGEDFHAMIQETMNKYKQMDTLMLNNEQVLLRQLAADVEMVDNEEGMSKKEWRRFKARLPKRYKLLVEREDITFESLDTDGSESIDPKELTAMIQRLIDLHEAEKMKMNSEESVI